MNGGAKVTEKKSKRGGARPGSGPKPKPQEEKSVSFIVSCTRDELAKINAAAERAGVPRSRLILEAVKDYAKR